VPQQTVRHGSQALSPTVTAGRHLTWAATLTGTANGTVTKGLDILTHIAQGGTANGATDGALAHPISFQNPTVTPR
jgi:hypothetical protein